MPVPDDNEALEERIDQWRGYLRRGRTTGTADLTRLEDRLREQVNLLVSSGLADDEAFLVAVKRLNDVDTASPERVGARTDRLWKQLVVSPYAGGFGRGRPARDTIVAFSLAVLAALLIKTPALFGVGMDDQPSFYARNASLFVLPLLTGYFAWKRGLEARIGRWLLGAFAAAAVFANVYPIEPEGNTEILMALHLPIALWVGVVGVAYAGTRWKRTDGRMDFVRFSGELFIHYVLIALGGGVFTAFMMMIFQVIGIDAEPFLAMWVLPCGAIGAVMVASWLVEARQNFAENIAPVLTRLFTPLFAALLVTFLVTLLLTGRGVNIDRDLLIAFDLLLVVVLGLLLYSLSARDPRSPPGAFDLVQVVLVVSALLANTVALWAIASRITEFGFTPNRMAALGMNAILLVNLAWSAVLYVRFIAGHGSFDSLERWQTNYLPVYALWAAIVVIVFPPLFGFI